MNEFCESFAEVATDDLDEACCHPFLVAGYHDCSKKKEITMSEKFTPNADRLLVRRVEKTTVTAGGIHIPDTAVEKSGRAVVLAVGPGRLVDGMRHPLPWKKGDTVLFTKYAGLEIEIDGENLVILHENDVLGQIEEA